MSLIRELVCVQCGKCYTGQSLWTCTACGPDEGILEIRFNLDAARRGLTRAALASRPQTHWRYRELLPLAEAFVPGGAGQSEVGRPAQHLVAPAAIGWTPVLEAPRLAAALGVRRLRLKDDGRNASASFKDRASSIGVAHALQLGKKEIACASTGNAASSLAHCAATAGMACSIFVPKSVPEGKLAQLLAYGARVFRVNGPYAAAYELCNAACTRFGWYNRNCAINPYLVEGKKTGGLEVAEQCADDPPQWVSVSVGDGCTIAGIRKGIAEMKAIGLIDWDAKMLGVQAVGVAAIAKAMDTGNLDRTESGTTYADSINCPVPRNWRKAVNAVRDSGGTYVTVSDEQIMQAVRETGRLSGIFAEPAAAAAVAGVAESRRKGIIAADADVLVMITGNGLKDIAGALRAVGKPNDVPAELGAVARIIEREGNRN